MNFFRMLFSNKKESKSKDEEIPDQSSLKDLKKEQIKMINGIIALSDTYAHEIMKPRIDVDSIDINEPLDKIFDKIINCGHSRIPAYDESIDNIVGVLYAKDLLKYFFKEQKAEINIKKILREPFFIPETKKVSDLLREFKEKKVHIAIVLDEYGGFSGIVCLEDILEEIVGEIFDEYDTEEKLIEKISDKEYLITSKISIFDLNEELKLSLPEDLADTLGGFIMENLGDIPKKGDSFTYQNCEFSIHSMTGYKIDKVLLKMKELDNE
ncbi:MAG: hemolysin family protein [Exilispira sp.]|nr:hemolysin family protein [Exilispira sp.]